MPLLSPPPSWPAGRHGQRGAVSILAAVGLLIVVASALLAVDLGNLFYTKRNLQTVADTAALSAVNNLAMANGIALNTATINNFPVPGTQSNTLATVTGRYDYQDRSFAAGGPATDQNAVQVTVTTQQPYFFALGSLLITATATAARTDVAGISVGSGLLDINTEQSALLNGLLGGLLKTSLNLTVSSYKGLLNTSVRLLDLLNAQADVGTVHELLAADVKLADLLRLTATALSQTDIAVVDATVINDLNLLALKVPGDLRLKLADLLDASLAPGNAAADAQINVLQLLTLSAQVANGEHFLNVPVSGLDLGGLASLKITLSLIEPPKIAIGPPGQDANGNWRTQAHTAQWRLKLDVKVLELVEGATGLINLPIYLEIAAGDARLASIDCNSPRNDSVVTVNANTSLLRAYIGKVNSDAMTNVTKAATVEEATLVSLTGLLGLTGILDVTARAAIDLPGAAQSLEFNGPFNDQNTQRISGLSTAGLFQSLGTNLDLDIELLGLKLGLGSLLKPVLKALAPIFGLLDALLAPVLQLLGIQLGFGDVTAFHLKCGAPQLVR